MKLKMMLNPTFFTYENLTNLKFKELQKLSKQLCVNRRWAKKQDLINNLLALKDNEASNNDKTSNVNQVEEKEWKDGHLVFNDLGKNPFSEDGLNKRLTYSITNKSAVYPHITFKVPQNGKNSLDINDKNVDSRQTYDIPPNGTYFDVQSLMDNPDFDMSPKGKLSTEENDSRATFNIIQNKIEFLGKNEDQVSENTNSGSIYNEKELVKEKDSVKKLSVKKDFKKVAFGSLEKEKPKTDTFNIKMLTIPYLRVTRRMRKNGETIKNYNSPLKMSKKSINIKKSSRQAATKLDLTESPALSHLNKSIGEETILQPLTKCKAVKMMQSKIPMKLQPRKEQSMQKEATSSINRNKNANVINNLRIKSKTADEVHVKKPSLVKIGLISLPTALTNNCTVYAPLKKTSLKGEVKSISEKFNSQTPSVTTKPLTAIKMPDFKKIHQKQFEQMDSLHDYIIKKQERAKRLFGTPHPTFQSKVEVKSIPFRFQSTTCEKSDVKFDETKSRNSKTKTTAFNKENSAKDARTETFKKKLPPTKSQAEIKDNNRSQILGVRTNKRFELQMKLRNIGKQDEQVSNMDEFEKQSKGMVWRNLKKNRVK